MIRQGTTPLASFEAAETAAFVAGDAGPHLVVTHPDREPIYIPLPSTADATAGALREWRKG